MRYNKAMSASGGGKNSIKEQTELQYTVVSIMGTTARQGIAVVEGCNTSEEPKLEANLKRAASYINEIVDECTAEEQKVQASENFYGYCKITTTPSKIGIVSDTKADGERSERKEGGDGRIKGNPERN
ncbi:unnamed protein product [Clavelina lepadiformis]|uniref:Uncharacterized protein n=1 Tax=Clavelina lepadiformis TaxID=159417 RepID=A0ABP0GY58_CLALP